MNVVFYKTRWSQFVFKLLSSERILYFLSNNIYRGNAFHKVFHDRKNCTQRCHCYLKTYDGKLAKLLIHPSRVFLPRSVLFSMVTSEFIGRFHCGSNICVWIWNVYGWLLYFFGEINKKENKNNLLNTYSISNELFLTVMYTLLNWW